MSHCAVQRSKTEFKLEAWDNSRGMIVLEFSRMSRKRQQAKRQQALKGGRWRLTAQRWTIQWTVSETAHRKRTGQEVEIR